MYLLQWLQTNYLYEDSRYLRRPRFDNWHFPFRLWNQLNKRPQVRRVNSVRVCFHALFARSEQNKRVMVMSLPFVHSTTKVLSKFRLIFLWGRFLFCLQISYNRYFTWNSNEDYAVWFSVASFGYFATSMWQKLPIFRGKLVPHFLSLDCPVCELYLLLQSNTSHDNVKHQISTF